MDRPTELITLPHVHARRVKWLVKALYPKAPKKCRELELIVMELRACLDQSELPLTGVHLYAPAVRDLLPTK